jgi:hypothetical protein
MRYGGISAKFMSNINVLIVNRRSLEIPDAGQRATSISNNNVPNTYKKKTKTVSQKVRFTRVLNWPTHAIKSPIYTRTSWIQHFFVRRVP